MRGSMGKDEKTEVPSTLPDERRFFVKGENDQWKETPIQDLVPDQVIAVVDESEWSPQEVDLWVIYGIPYLGKAGLWTVEVNRYKPSVDTE